MRQAVLDLETIPTPFMIIDNLLPELFGTGSPSSLEAPRRYTQLILRGLAGIVDDVDRYVLRFTRDFTLRDDLITRNYTTDLTTDFSRIGAEPLDLKSHHTEWTLIREKQSSNIPRVLWDRITESIIAEKLTDSSSRVPSLSRELYDVNFGTDTRYGLGDEQVHRVLHRRQWILDLVRHHRDQLVLPAFVVAETGEVAYVNEPERTPAVTGVEINDVEYHVAAVASLVLELERLDRATAGDVVDERLGVDDVRPLEAAHVAQFTGTDIQRRVGGGIV